MEQYIPKSAVVAEIYKLMGNPELIEDWRYRVKMEERNELLKNIINTIDTLEVKEVDLEKELNTWRHNHFHGRRDIFASGEYLERISQLDIAKHFFELGLKVAQKGEYYENR